jgi:hypothetical protein
MALVGGFATRRFRREGEAAFETGVIDLDQVSVFVLGNEGVAGEEVDIGAICAGGEET